MRLEKKIIKKNLKNEMLKQNKKKKKRKMQQNAVTTYCKIAINRG